MNPIEELKTEHRAVEDSLRILEGICERIGKDGEISEPAHVELFTADIFPLLVCSHEWFNTPSDIHFSLASDARINAGRSPGFRLETRFPSSTTS
jgi:hypothetical protein